MAMHFFHYFFNFFLMRIFHFYSSRPSMQQFKKKSNGLSDVWEISIHNEGLLKKPKPF